MPATAFELPPAAVGDRARRGTRPDPRRGTAARGRPDGLVAHATFRDLPALPEPPATCWWSTPRHRCPRRSTAVRRAARPGHGAPGDAAADDGTGWSSCAPRRAPRARCWTPRRRAGPAAGRAAASAARAATPTRAPAPATGCGGRRLTGAGPVCRLPARARPADRATATCAAASRSRATRRSSPPSPAAPRCRAPAGRSPRRSGDRAGRRAASPSRRSRCTPGCRRRRRASRRTAEWFRVPAATARLVTSTGRRGGRVVAVGTTVTRALESGGDAGRPGQRRRRAGPTWCSAPTAPPASSTG